MGSPPDTVTPPPLGCRYDATCAVGHVDDTHTHAAMQTVHIWWSRPEASTTFLHTAYTSEQYAMWAKKHISQVCDVWVNH